MFVRGSSGCALEMHRTAVAVRHHGNADNERVMGAGLNFLLLLLLFRGGRNHQPTRFLENYQEMLYLPGELERVAHCDSFGRFCGKACATHMFGGFGIFWTSATPGPVLYRRVLSVSP